MVEQRTDEWFKQRAGRITGSKIGAILGLSPYQSAKDVMRAMVREYHGAEKEFTGNVATEYGSMHEHMAIFDFELETGSKVEETGFHIHHEHDWLGASPDGLVGDDATIEVKCPYSKRDGGEFKTLDDQLYYKAQVMYEMYCTGRKRCYFYQWSQHNTSLEVVEFDQGYIEETLPKLKAFHDKYLKEIKDPDRHLAPLVKTRDAQCLADEYLAAKQAVEEANKRLDAAKQSLIEIADGEKSCVSGLLVYKVQRQGSVKYAQVVKDMLPDVDLEAYRGKSSEHWVIK